ncbi:hypothetical protein X975_10365, partial [Stegodyphus mimosarum]
MVPLLYLKPALYGISGLLKIQGSCRYVHYICIYKIYIYIYINWYHGSVFNTSSLPITSS